MAFSSAPSPRWVALPKARILVAEISHLLLSSPNGLSAPDRERHLLSGGDAQETSARLATARVRRGHESTGQGHARTQEDHEPPEERLPGDCSVNAASRRCGERRLAVVAAAREASRPGRSTVGPERRTAPCLRRGVAGRPRYRKAPRPARRPGRMAVSTAISVASPPAARSGVTSQLGVEEYGSSASGDLGEVVREGRELGSEHTTATSRRRQTTAMW
jgi:hypothetical protein